MDSQEVTGKTKQAEELKASYLAENDGSVEDAMLAACFVLLACETEIQRLKKQVTHLQDQTVLAASAGMNRQGKTNIERKRTIIAE